jgi:hypothetical protein
MKKIIAITIIAFITTSLIFVSCKKEEIQKIQMEKNVKQTRMFRISASYGTRHKAADNERHDAIWGTSFSNGNECQGRSLCVKFGFANAPSNYTAGGLLPFENQTLDAYNSYWSISKDLTNKFFVEIGPNDILPATAQRIFEGENFIQDYDYELPTFICNSLGVNSLTLKAGNHPIIRENGKIKFFF